MKKIQIEQNLFVQMVKYFYSDELGFDDDDVCELYHKHRKRQKYRAEIRYPVCKKCLGERT